jgi:hypothetical protein
MLNCVQARAVSRSSGACKEYALAVSQAVSMMRQRNEIQQILAKVSSPKFDVDASLHQELQRYFLAALSHGDGEQSYLPKEIRSKDEVLATIPVFHRIQANRDRVIAIKMGLQDIYQNLLKLWDLGYMFIMEQDAEIKNLRSAEQRDRAVGQILSELSEKMKNFENLIAKCKEVTDNLNSTYYILHAMLEAAKFGVRELHPGY